MDIRVIIIIASFLIIILTIIIVSFLLKNRQLANRIDELTNALNEEKEQTEVRVKEETKLLTAEIETVRAQAEQDVLACKEQIERDKQDFQKEFERELAAERQRSEDALRTERETIQTKRDALMERDEKELLADVLMALDGYGSRISYLEKSMGDNSIITRLDQIKTSMDVGVSSISARTSAQMDILSDTVRASMASMTSRISGEMSQFSSLIDERLTESDVLNSLSDINQTIGTLQNEITGLRSDSDAAAHSLHNVQSNGILDTMRRDMEETRITARSAQTCASEAKAAALEAAAASASALTAAEDLTAVIHETKEIVLNAYSSEHGSSSAEEEILE